MNLVSCRAVCPWICGDSFWFDGGWEGRCGRRDMCGDLSRAQSDSKGRSANKRFVGPSVKLSDHP